MTKAEIRKQAKEKRQSLTAEDLETASEQICKLFFRHFDLTSVQYIHLFLPIIRLKEINTWPIIDFIQQNFSNIRIVFPQTIPEDHSMKSFLFDANLALKENAWGILEPVEGNPITAQLIDMVLLPLLGFDTRGYRVGYGKGFYDRFLTTCREDIIKIGLSISEPVMHIDNIDPFDIPMDSCITPYKVWHFGR